jgi:hypothetical protein
MLMINNHFARFQLPGNLFKTKNVLPIFVATRNFLFIYIVVEMKSLLYETKVDFPISFLTHVMNVAAP